MHLDFDDAVALTSLATSALDVEAESPGVVAAGPRFGYGCEQFAQRSKESRIRRRVGTGCAPDRALIDVDDTVNLLEAINPLTGRSVDDCAIESRGCMSEQGIVDESRLA